MNAIKDNTNFADLGKDLASKAADKIQGGLQDAKNLAGEVGSELAGKAQAAASHGRDMIDTAMQQVCDTAADLSGSLMKYTKKNPGKSLLLAAASGALLATLVFARTPSRD
jgi:ElaB/YqjD/DUF883 family membrane-anchored ribosome-binding protein